MKIIALQAENIKKLVAVEIKPNGALVQITGKNGQGKTSVLDSIWWAIAGASNIQSAPIRNGAKEARIKLDLGELVVTRTFRRKPKEGEPEEIVTSITVTKADGSLFKSPQTVLDGLLGALTFDPLEFERMDPKAQFNALRKFVPDVDFDAIDAAHEGDVAKRRDINRDAKQARGAAGAIPEPMEAVVDLTPVDEFAITRELTAASEINAGILAERQRRQGLKERVALLREGAQGRRGQSEALAVGHVTEAKRLRDELDQRIKDMETRSNANIVECEREAKKLDEEAANIEGELAEAAAEMPLVDAQAVQARLLEAKKRNAGIAEELRRKQYLDQAAALEKQAEEITARMEARQANKVKAIAAVKLPVEGLGFGEGIITLTGVPFDQASGAERLRVSCAIAMASNPKLRVIRVRDGSLLDEDSLKIVEAMAVEKDFQVWVERVDSSGKVGFVLENGQAHEAAQETLV